LEQLRDELVAVRRLDGLRDPRPDLVFSAFVAAADQT
jgi:hypothetical protein